MYDGMTINIIFQVSIFIYKSNMNNLYCYIW